MNGSSGKRPAGKQPTAQPAAKQSAQQPATSSQPTGPAGWTDANVIGYTYSRQLTETDVEDFINGKYKGKKYPTVYYEEGRRTLAHHIKSNVRWHGRYQRAFFGNVNLNWLNQADVENLHQIQLQDLLQELRKTAKMHRAHSEWKNSTDDHRCTSYIVAPPANAPSKARFEKDIYELKFQHGSKLLELIFSGTNLVPHPSRNQFRWAKNSDTLQKALHKLALKGPA